VNSNNLRGTIRVRPLTLKQMVGRLAEGLNRFCTGSPWREVLAPCHLLYGVAEEKKTPESNDREVLESENTPTGPG